MTHRRFVTKATSAFVCLLSSIVALACSGSDDQMPLDIPANGALSGGGGTSGSNGAAAGDAEADPLPAPPVGSKACELKGATATDVAVKFDQDDPPTSSGGKLEGTFVIEETIVHLPFGTRPAQSKGTSNGWAVFSEGNYNISLKFDLTIGTLIGTKAAKKNVIGQGTFKTDKDKVQIETSCPGNEKPEVSIAFTEEGAKTTLVVETKEEGQTIFVVLHMKKQ